MALIIALAWPLAMIVLFGWLVWWDRSERRLPMDEMSLDVLTARAQDGEEACERYLWETLIADLNDYHDLRWALEYQREHPA